MKIKSPDVYNPKAPIKSSFWVTLGGKIQDNESLLQAAKREAFEETGKNDINIVGPVWFGSVDLNWKGVMTQLQETFLLAYCNSNNISKDYLEEEERAVIENYKWWSIEELTQTNEVIIPKNLAQMLPSLLSEAVPGEPLEIDLS